MAEYVFTTDQVRTLTDNLQFVGEKTLHDEKLRDARIVIARLLLLEKNPVHLSQVLSDLEKLAEISNLNIYFEAPSGAIESVHIAEIIGSTREAVAGSLEISQLMRKLKGAFRL